MVGLLDQYLAILWVYNNIASFGGNRNEITLMGHSTGAASAVYHSLSSRSNGYIQRILTMSGSVMAPWARQPNPRENARRFAHKLSCYSNNSKLLLDCLQSKSMEEIIDTVDDMIRDGNSSAIFAPVIDSEFLSLRHRFIDSDPEMALKRGLNKNVRDIYSFIYNHFPKKIF